MSRPRCEYGGPPQCMFDPETCARCNPAAPAAEADLRAAIHDGLASAGWSYGYRTIADIVVNLPALQRLKAEAAEARRLRETVARVDILVRDLEHSGMPLTAAQLRRALDGTDG